MAHNKLDIAAFVAFIFIMFASIDLGLKALNFDLLGNIEMGWFKFFDFSIVKYIRWTVAISVIIVFMHMAYTAGMGSMIGIPGPKM